MRINIKRKIIFDPSVINVQQGTIAKSTTHVRVKRRSVISSESDKNQSRIVDNSGQIQVMSESREVNVAREDADTDSTQDPPIYKYEHMKIKVNSYMIILLDQ